MTTETTADLALSLTFEEAASLQKTIGIAIVNVGRKASTLPKNSTLRAEALQDYRHLQSINAELSFVLEEGIR